MSAISAKAAIQSLHRWIPRSLILVVLTVACPLSAAAPPEIEEQTRQLAAELRCVVCQNLSVADSPSEMAQQMRAIVREQLEAGKTPEQVKEYFVSKYGEWVLLRPKTTGFSALLWILPYTVLVFGVLLALWVIWRWAGAKTTRAKVAAASGAVDVHGDFLKEDFQRPDPEDTSARAALLRERARLRDELNELEFDFQAGKLSEADYLALEQEIGAKAAAVIQQLNALPPEPRAAPRSSKKSPEKSDRTAAPERARLRRWQLVGGAVFFVAFGIALGVMLSQSVRPRLSESDTMTGDFLTGTSPAGAIGNAALLEGRSAFNRQDYAKAIEAFKKVLDRDPDNAEAHTYMGFILARAGHSEGALMAFDKALARAPNFPIALWGKGMLLYRQQKDYAGARDVLERLLALMPPGEDRNQVAETLMEIPAASGEPPASTASSPTAGVARSSAAQISGRITVEPKLEANLDPKAVLFIIARSGAGRPPLAVKKIERPKFPLDYSLGQDNVMMQGTPFTGKVNVTARLDKDGNPVTRGSGDLTGEYKKNPVAVGAKNVDIVVDQIAR